MIDWEAQGQGPTKNKCEDAFESIHKQNGAHVSKCIGDQAKRTRNPEGSCHRRQTHHASKLQLCNQRFWCHQLFMCSDGMHHKGEIMHACSPGKTEHAALPWWRDFAHSSCKKNSRACKAKEAGVSFPSTLFEALNAHNLRLAIHLLAGSERWADPHCYRGVIPNDRPVKKKELLWNRGQEKTAYGIHNLASSRG